MHRLGARVFTAQRAAAAGHLISRLRFPCSFRRPGLC
jgi:hypothetical protein